MTDSLSIQSDNALNFTNVDDFQICYRNSNEFTRSYNEIFLKNIYQLSFSEEKKVVLDLGAHIGISTLYIKKMWPNSEILAFEPNPHTFQVLARNIAINNCTNVKLHNCAAYNSNVMTKLYGCIMGIDIDSRGNSLIQSWGQREQTEEIEIKAVKISDFIKTKIDFLKIDIEGSEQIVLDDLVPQMHQIQKIAVDYHSTSECNPHNSLEHILKILTQNFKEIKIIMKDPCSSLPDKWHDWIKQKNVCLAYILASK